VVPTHVVQARMSPRDLGEAACTGPLQPAAGVACELRSTAHGLDAALYVAPETATRAGFPLQPLPHIPPARPRGTRAPTVHCNAPLFFDPVAHRDQNDPISKRNARGRAP